MIPRILMQNVSKKYHTPCLYKVFLRLDQSILRCQSLTTKQQEDNSKPIQYTKSKAFKYKAYENFRFKEEEEKSTVPSYNGLVIKASFALFLIYFCYLREPNDIDDMLSRDLFEIVPDIEIPMLEVDIKRLEKQGMNVDDLKIKLAELKRLDEEKKKQNNNKQSSNS